MDTIGNFTAKNMKENDREKFCVFKEERTEFGKRFHQIIKFLTISKDLILKKFNVKKFNGFQNFKFKQFKKIQILTFFGNSNLLLRI